MREVPPKYALLLLGGPTACTESFRPLDSLHMEKLSEGVQDVPSWRQGQLKKLQRHGRSPNLAPRPRPVKTLAPC